jgi:hypothetical protein
MGNYWISGQDLKVADYFNALNGDKAQVVQVVDKNSDQEPHMPHTSLASSLIAQIEILGKMPVKF